MKSAAVSVMVKSDRMRKRFPRPGEMVRVVDRIGLFAVVRIDRTQRVADLMQRVGKVDVVDANVPFDQIRTVSTGVSRAIREFLNQPLIPESITRPAEAKPSEVPPTNLQIGQLSQRSEGDPATLAAHREPVAS